MCQQMRWGCLAKTRDQVTVFLWRIGKIKAVIFIHNKTDVQEGLLYSLLIYPAVGNTLILLQISPISTAKAFGKDPWVILRAHQRTVRRGQTNSGHTKALPRRCGWVVGLAVGVFLGCTNSFTPS